MQLHHLRAILWLFVSFGFGLTPAFAQTTGGTNSWTKPTSGYWEEPFWSLGQFPNHDQAAVAFNNPGFKALAIGTNTTANFPGSLWIQNLLIESPTNSANQLLLNYAGLAVPLRIDNDLRVGTNSSLVSYYSAIQGASFYLGGVASFDQLSEASFSSQVGVGTDGSPGQLNVLDGSFSANRLVLSLDGSSAALNLGGGTMQSGSFVMNGQSTLTVSNGVLNTGSFSMNGEGAGGVAVVNLYSGLLTASNTIPVGTANNGPVGSGTFVMSGGNFHSPGITAFHGDFRQSG